MSAGKDVAKKLGKKAAKKAGKAVAAKIGIGALPVILVILIVVFVVVAILGMVAGSQASAQNVNGAMIEGIPPLLQSGFHNAVVKIKETRPECGITAGILGAIAEKESGFAIGPITSLPDGAVREITITGNGDVTPGIRAGMMNNYAGSNDDGVFDGDPTNDWALGPFQFMAPTFYGTLTPQIKAAGPNVPIDLLTGNGQALDGNGDGVVNLQNVFDASLAAANYLCASSPTGSVLKSDGSIDESALLTAMRVYGGSANATEHIERAKDLDRQYAEAAAAQGISGDVTPGGSANSPQGPIQLSDVPGIGPMNSLAAPQAAAMIRAAAAQGVTLTGGSYRSYDSQVALRKSHCGTSHYAIYEMPASSCRPPTARPGRSQHEVGLAIDFNNCSSRRTACFIWLNNNAARFGFKNLPSEPWHWSTTGS